MRAILWLATLPLLAACSEQRSSPETTTAPAVPATAPAAAIPVDADNVVRVQDLPLNQLPAGVPRQPGRVLELKQWTDQNGLNLLVLTRTPVRDDPPQPDGPEEAQSVDMYARQYVQRAGQRQWQELWHLQDGVAGCPFDLGLGPVPGATSVTDLDADGLTETTLLYSLTCTSDVSPATLKLILHEGKAKYALRGYTVVQYDSIPASERRPANACCLDTISAARLEEHYELFGGRYENEKDFRKAPPAFLRFARQEWQRWSVRGNTLEEL
ncbi:M949_RS01915 family surface polysaccharide biosynthesis protein [Hymenobacter sp. UYP22]|uniref:M949_RS01915 family surface polysaccharide biosynthesis protein n=1 Tax=Hymenobacter sp. UYP22 TaxID=3156348 RepID=UPI0033959033